MLLSVVSVLARSDLDPWAEAARLAGLPEKYATARLAALIAALPGRSSVPAGCMAIAGRLVTLLPRRAGLSNAEAPKARPTAMATPNLWVIVCVIVMALVLGVQWITASNWAPVQGNHAGASAATTTSAVVPPPTAGK